jgi:hypothetical protein
MAWCFKGSFQKKEKYIFEIYKKTNTMSRKVMQITYKKRLTVSKKNSIVVPKKGLLNSNRPL